MNGAPLGESSTNGEDKRRRSDPYPKPERSNSNQSVQSPDEDGRRAGASLTSESEDGTQTL